MTTQTQQRWRDDIDDLDLGELASLHPTAETLSRVGPAKTALLPSITSQPRGVNRRALLLGGAAAAITITAVGAAALLNQTTPATPADQPKQPLLKTIPDGHFLTKQIESRQGTSRRTLTMWEDSDGTSWVLDVVPGQASAKPTAVGPARSLSYLTRLPASPEAARDWLAARGEGPDDSRTSAEITFTAISDLCQELRTTAALRARLVDIARVTADTVVEQKSDELHVTHSIRYPSSGELAVERLTLHPRTLHHVSSRVEVRSATGTVIQLHEGVVTIEEHLTSTPPA